MCQFMNDYKVALLVVGLVTAGASMSRESMAGKPRGDPKANEEQMVPASEKAWGNVRMRFVVDSPNEEAVKGRHTALHEMADDEALAIDAASHGLRNVVALVRHVSRAHPMYAHDSERSVVLIIHDQRFVPHVLPITVGQLLRIQNRDATMQIALMRPSREQEMNQLLAPGNEATWRFTHAEIVPVAVTSTLNPSMSAYIVIVDNPYVGVSDDHGTIALTNLPAEEELDLRFWHERSGWLVLSDVPVKTHLSNGHLRIVVPPDGRLDLGEIHIPLTALTSPSQIDWHSRLVH